MSYQHVHHVLTTSPTKGLARMVLVVLAESADNQGVCWLSVDTIAKRANTKEDEARKVLHQLKGDGHICIEKRPGTSNRYKLPTPKLAETPPPVVDLPYRGSTPPVGEATPPPVGEATPPPVGEGNHHLTVNEPSLLQDGDNPHTVFLENFGMLTPMLAEELTDLEADYTRAWVVDAMRIAVLKGVRNLRYVAGILRRWKAEGRKDTPLAAEQPAPVSTTLKEYKP